VTYYMAFALLLAVLVIAVTVAMLVRALRGNEKLAASAVNLENTLSLALQQLTRRAEHAEKIAEQQVDNIGILSRQIAEYTPDTVEKDFLRHLIIGLQEQIVQNTRDARSEAAKANARVLAIIDSKAEGLVTGQALRANGLAPATDDLRSSPPESHAIDPIRFPEERSRRVGEARIDRPDPPALAGSQYTEPEPEPAS